MKAAYSLLFERCSLSKDRSKEHLLCIVHCDYELKFTPTTLLGNVLITFDFETLTLNMMGR